MKNTNKQRNKSKKTMKGKGFFSSYKAPQDPVTELETASDGKPCQAQLLNKDGKTQARKGIECSDGNVCQTNTGKKIKSSVKPVMYWGQKDVGSGNMGFCGDPANIKGFVARTTSAAKNTVQGTAYASLRLNELGKMCGFIPSIQTTESGLNFSKNLWRNLKRNMTILSSIPSDQLQTLLNTPQSKSDYKNLSTRLQKHGVNLDPNEFSDNNNKTQANPNEDWGETAPLMNSDTTLPEGWSSNVDKTSGETYYISPSGETQWKSPTSGGKKRKNKSKKNKRNKSKKFKKNLSKKNRLR